jgi:hypothetical protein
MTMTGDSGQQMTTGGDTPRHLAPKFLRGGVFSKIDLAFKRVHHCPLGAP